MEAQARCLLSLSDGLLEELLLSCWQAHGIRITALASSCRRLNALCRRAFAQQLKLQGGDTAAYKAAIIHAARGMPRIDTLMLQCDRAFQSDETPAQLLLSCKALAALRSLQLTISSSSSSCSTITALDVLALAELTALTSLRLAATHGPDDATAPLELFTTELSPLSRLTALQQLSLDGWQPLGVAGSTGLLPAAVAAAAGECCMPVSGQLTSLRLYNMQSLGIMKWLPSMLACTQLQQLQMRVAPVSTDRNVNYIMNACVQHLTALTALQMLLAVDSTRGAGKWTRGAQHLSLLQQLQQLQLQADDDDQSALGRVPPSIYVNAEQALFRCSALRALGELCVGDEQQPVPAGVVLPHLSYLRLYQYPADVEWPADAFPSLKSLYLIFPAEDCPCHPENIPGSSSIAELTLCPCPFAFHDGQTQPVAEDMQQLAAALPQLQSLHLILPSELDGAVAADEQQEFAMAWLQSLTGFTQLQQLAVTVPNRHITSSGLLPVVRQEDVLRTLCKLQQLRQLSLSGWAWEVSPVFVVGLEVGLRQLTSIRLQGCGGYGEAASQENAEMRQGMQRVAVGLRAGLQLVYVD